MTQDEKDERDELSCAERAKKMLNTTFEDGTEAAIVLTTMTYAVAAICATMGVDPAVFMERVAITMRAARIDGGAA